MCITGCTVVDDQLKETGRALFLSLEGTSNIWPVCSRGRFLCGAGAATTGECTGPHASPHLILTGDGDPYHPRLQRGLAESK